jgi:chromosome segregation ATPase
VLLFAGPAWAAPVDDARETYAAAQVDRARIQHARVELAKRQDVVAREIEALKASDQALLPGVRGGQLDARLKTAGALADQLAHLDRRLADARRDADQAALRVREALQHELNRVRQALAAAEPSQRAALFAQLKALANEQSTLSALRAQAQSPAESVALPAVAGDDPDELRELADEAMDHAEKMRAQLALVDQRLGELRDRRRLLRAEVAFQRDELLFAEAERNRVVVRVKHTPGSGAVKGDETPSDDEGQGGAVAAADPALAESPTAAPGGGGDDNAPPASGSFEGDGARDADGDSQDGNEAMGAEDPAPAPEPEPGPAPLATALPGAAVGAASDGVLVVGASLDPALLTNAVDTLSADGLVARIAAIEAQRAALEASVQRLDARRSSLQDRAAALENE